MEELRKCKGCSAEMNDDEETWGTDMYGEPVEDFCQYCLVLGKRYDDFNIDRMIETVVSQMLNDEENITEEEAREEVTKKIQEKLD